MHSRVLAYISHFLHSKTLPPPTSTPSQRSRFRSRSKIVKNPILWAKTMDHIIIPLLSLSHYLSLSCLLEHPMPTALLFLQWSTATIAAPKLLQNQIKEEEWREIISQGRRVERDHLSPPPIPLMFFSVWGPLPATSNRWQLSMAHLRRADTWPNPRQQNSTWPVVVLGSDSCKEERGEIPLSLLHTLSTPKLMLSTSSAIRCHSAPSTTAQASFDQLRLDPFVVGRTETMKKEEEATLTLIDFSLWNLRQPLPPATNCWRPPLMTASPTSSHSTQFGLEFDPIREGKKREKRKEEGEEEGWLWPRWLAWLH